MTAKTGAQVQPRPKQRIVRLAGGLEGPHVGVAGLLWLAQVEELDAARRLIAAAPSRGNVYGCSQPDRIWCLTART